MKIVLCRTLETAYERQGTLAGQRSTEPNRAGWGQGVTLIQRVAALNDNPIGAILCSDQDQAKFLGELLEVRLRVPLIIDRELREVDLGEMTGLSEANALEKYPELRHRTHNADFNYGDIGGESANTVRGRYYTSLCVQIESLRREGVRSIVLVGHDIALALVFVHTLCRINRLPERDSYKLVDWA